MNFLNGPKLQTFLLQKFKLKYNVRYSIISTHDVIVIMGMSQQEATRLVAPLATGTPTTSPQLHGPLNALAEYSSVGLQCPQDERWGTAMSDGIKNIRLGLLAVRFPTSTLGNF